MLWRVRLGFVVVDGGGFFGLAEVVAAVTAELFIREVLAPALRAQDNELLTTFSAEFPGITVFRVALRTRSVQWGGPVSLQPHPHAFQILQIPFQTHLLEHNSRLFQVSVCVYSVELLVLALRLQHPFPDLEVGAGEVGTCAEPFTFLDCLVPPFHGFALFADEPMVLAHESENPYPGRRVPIGMSQGRLAAFKHIFF